MVTPLKSIFWPDNTKDAKAIQSSLKNKVKNIPLRRAPKLIAAVDAAFSENHIICAACLYKYPDLILLEESFSIKQVLFPYIPGFLSFREGPAIIEAIGNFVVKPDLILFDGQGIAHPKGLGIASHIGVLLSLPTIGCAKSRLVGEYVIGAVLRTKDNVRPLFVSPGHKIDLQASIDIILACTIGYRLPEPLRKADFLSRKIKRERIIPLGSRRL